MLDDPDRAGRIEASLIMRHAELWALRDLAEETALMRMRSVPEPSLDIELSELSTDMGERVKQLELLLLANREQRRRCQDSLRTALDWIGAGGPLLV